MIPRVLRAARLPAWLSGLACFLFLTAFVPSTALASLPTLSDRQASSVALPHLPSALGAIEQRESERVACGVFCGEPLQLRLRAAFPSKTPFLVSQDAWGNFRVPEDQNPSDPAAAANKYAFTGHIFDRETGLYYAKARYMDPQLGRFLTQDSYLGEANEPPSLHRYAYGHNRPTFYVDPTGHDVQLSTGEPAKVDPGPSYWDRARVTVKGWFGITEPGPVVEGGGSITPASTDPLDVAAAIQRDKQRTIDTAAGGAQVAVTVSEGVLAATPLSDASTIVRGRDINDRPASRKWAIAALFGGVIVGTVAKFSKWGDEVADAAATIAGVQRTEVAVAAGVTDAATTIQKVARTPLDRPTRDALRTAARDIWQSNTGRRAIWDDMEVHHRIPLEWSHLFPADPNRVANLAGVANPVHSQISKDWNAWRKGLGNAQPTAAQVMEKALRIDEKYGSQMTFVR